MVCRYRAGAVGGAAADSGEGRRGSRLHPPPVLERLGAPPYRLRRVFRSAARPGAAPPNGFFESLSLEFLESLSLEFPESLSLEFLEPLSLEVLEPLSLEFLEPLSLENVESCSSSGSSVPPCASALLIWGGFQADGAAALPLGLPDEETAQAIVERLSATRLVVRAPNPVRACVYVHARSRCACVGACVDPDKVELPLARKKMQCWWRGMNECGR